MFWRFNYMPSRIDTLLDKEDVTLKELMDEDDVVQECKSQNKKLVDFLIQPHIMETLINMVVGTPSEADDQKSRFKYPNIACDLITSDVAEITETIASSDSLLNSIYAFIESDSDLNPLQASFFSKVMGLLITRKSYMTINFLKSRNSFVDHLLRHLGVSAIMDVLLRLITCIESTECRNDCIIWLNEQRLIARLVAMIDSEYTSEKHTNAAQSLCDIIRLSREQISLMQDSTTCSDALLKSIETSETVSCLLDRMLNGDPNESVIVNGLYVIQTLLECRKTSAEDGQEPMSLLDPQQLSPGTLNAINAIIARLKDMHQLLLEPPKQHYMPMPTSFGELLVPLGQTRLQIARLISMLIMTNVESVGAELATLGTMSVLLNLFFEYSWNNFLHAYVEQCIAGILSSSQCSTQLQNQLLNEFHLIERIAEAFEANKLQQSTLGEQRRGYMGHLTRVANQLANSTQAVASEQKHISVLFGELPEEVRTQWNECVSGGLADINKLNTVALVGTSNGLTSSSDDDDEFRSISFPQNDALQKAFVEYQQQKMTSDFVEQFGYCEEEFAEQEECVGSAMFNDRISNISFELRTVEDCPSAAAMFEHACSDRVRQFDNADSDEELWEDKELPYAEKRNGLALSSGNTNAANAAASVDSDDDDYGVDQDEGGEPSEGSDDSDPELPSPRFVRQTELDGKTSTPAKVISVPSSDAVVGNNTSCVPNDTVAEEPVTETKPDKEDDKQQTEQTTELVSKEQENGDDVTTRLPCHADLAVSDAVSNGPV